MATNLNWTGPLCTSHDTPLIASPLPNRADGMRRVSLPSLSALDPSRALPTVWFYDDSGKRPRDTGDEFNLVNFDPKDGVRRIDLQKAG